ncbi:MAG TPA: hypothetical protein PK079_09660 [Leptospiraceae bacterium]|nr:hypothetical protein [Leptospiraceae bacterium]HMW04572.1 hypothetical protein [Leptospiraceae bacterium]HMX33275.1 hypothetical protein [Leptospiraceae bacterium]HMY30758.1 hypothetical protein [Leptospiraceae bacterium]HMZ64336.1 hypothetical protein [Leptospiraceae bacterium]
MNKPNRKEEITFRLNSNEWDKDIAAKVTNKYQRKVRRNRVIATSAFLLLMGVSTFITFFYQNPVETEYMNLQAFQFLFSDDLFPIFDAFYQEESISFFADSIL